jgi:hypothetical protein
MSLRTINDDLHDPGLKRLLSRAQERFEALGGPRGRIVVPLLDPDEARAIDSVWKRTARRIPPRHPRVSADRR